MYAIRSYYVVGLAIEQGVIPQPNIGMSASDGIDSLIEGINQIRITSYNVCYTKLLRNNFV